MEEESISVNEELEDSELELLKSIKKAQNGEEDEEENI